jgi:hypothetical protein
MQKIDQRVTMMKDPRGERPVDDHESEARPDARTDARDLVRALGLHRDTLRGLVQRVRDAFRPARGRWQRLTALSVTVRVAERLTIDPPFSVPVADVDDDLRAWLRDRFIPAWIAWCLAASSPRRFRSPDGWYVPSMVDASPLDRYTALLQQLTQAAEEARASGRSLRDHLHSYAPAALRALLPVGWSAPKRKGWHTLTEPNQFAEAILAREGVIAVDVNPADPAADLSGLHAPKRLSTNARVVAETRARIRGERALDVVWSRYEAWLVERQAAIDELERALGLGLLIG